jgi:hypothetical protein
MLVPNRVPVPLTSRPLAENTLKKGDSQFKYRITILCSSAENQKEFTDDLFLVWPGGWFSQH